jgi:ATP-binding cassette subfamily C protein CydD
MMLGEQISDAVDRIEDVDGYHARFLPLRMAAVMAPLLIAAAVAVASPVSSAILLATLPPFALGMAIAGSAAGQAATRQFEALSRLSGLFVDRVRALQVIIGFGAEERIARQLGGATREVADRTVGILRVAFVSGAVIEFFAALSVALVAVYCGFSLLGLLPYHVPETLDIGRALFVLALAPEFYLPMRRLAAAYHDKQSGDAAAERLVRLAGRTDVPARTYEEFASPPSLSFEAITVDYGGHEVGPISLTVPSGHMTAITGPTGSGKSSLLHALLGLSPVASGRILIDDVPASAGLLKGNVGWLGQATALVPGTLADNIRLVRPDAGRAAIDRRRCVPGWGR